MQPRLRINKVSAPLKLISNTNITVTTTNDVGVPSTYNFPNSKLSEDNDLCLEFPITGRLSSIDVKVESKLLKLDQSENALTSSH